MNDLPGGSFTEPPTASQPQVLRRRRGNLWGVPFGSFIMVALLAVPAAFAEKATAPFDIATQFTGNHATVLVRAKSAVRDVEVEVSGSEGLVIIGGESRPPLQVKSVRRESMGQDEVIKIEVDFTPGGARGLLAVAAVCAGEPALVRGFYPGGAAKAGVPQAGAAATDAGGPTRPGPATLEWPIRANATFDAAHAHAHVTVTTTRPGTDIVVKVYGLDGLIVAGGTAENALLVHTERRASLKPGEAIEIDVGVKPGEGQSSLVVSAQGAGVGSVVRDFQVGELSEAQKRERQAGVTVDPEGVPIKIMNP